MATLSKLEIEDVSQGIYLLSELKDGNLFVQASDGKIGWEGTLFEAQLKVLAKRSKMDVDAYISDTRKALSRQNMGCLTFLYSVKRIKKDKIELAWKKYILSENIKFQLGEMELSEVQSSSIAASLLDFAVVSMNTLAKAKKELEVECERLGKERLEVLQELQDCVDGKDKVENELFSKFKLVLNEKKAKIRNLMDSLQNLREENEELRKKCWSGIPSDTPNPRAEIDIVSLATSTDCTTSEPSVPDPAHNTDSNKGAVTSLLHDVQCRAPSPPPAKRRRNVKSQKTVVDLGRPLAKTRTTSTVSPATSSSADKELDSDKLLDML